ncbi:hypothetical protein M8C21_006580 [Ambrosia artemisiifolia]|uniref:Serine aminopeptidase S33 domain-containing protein n=1 Tax=Ambrosia artemisiifolia TaxID=4212 RepID=A0AAD5G4Q9_AMBAR|nr:hypothetical protein M8C21_006580 [Ambrosia artemisiifolia]
MVQDFRGNEAPEPLQKVLIFLSRLMPKAKLADYNVISYSDQTRLKTAVERLNITNELESEVEKVSAPLLILHGAADKVTDPNISKFLYEKASSKEKTLKLYDGSYHCILEGESDERILELTQQKRHAALISLAQIAEGCSKVMIKNLEQVVSMVLMMLHLVDLKQGRMARKIGTQKRNVGGFDAPRNSLGCLLELLHPTR